MTIYKGLRAIKNYEDELERYYERNGNTDGLIEAYIKEMTDLGVPGAWHYQQFGQQEGEGSYEMRYTFALFNPDDELEAVLDVDDSFYTNYIDAQIAYEDGNYPLTWDEMMDSTGQHTAAWNALEAQDD